MCAFDHVNDIAARCEYDLFISLTVKYLNITLWSLCYRFNNIIGVVQFLWNCSRQGYSRTRFLFSVLDYQRCIRERLKKPRFAGRMASAIKSNWLLIWNSNMISCWGGEHLRKGDSGEELPLWKHWLSARSCHFDRVVRVCAPTTL